LKKIAFCNDIIEFQNNRIFIKEWAQKFPGASWVPAFWEMLSKENVPMVTGDMALSHVKCGFWQAEDILVIQELNSYFGRELICLGAKPFILTGFESPIFAYSFYDRLRKIGARFPNRILFSGAFELLNGSSGNNYQVHFPNYSAGNIQPLVPWNNRKFLVMVASNKYWKASFRFPLYRNPKRYIDWLWGQWLRWYSPTRRLSIKNELHSKRLDTIHYFGLQNKLDLFGPGWNDLKRLPVKYRQYLKQILKRLNVQPCDNKIKTMLGYKYAICFENVSYPGYVTEKIIDCFVAGVIPIYLGAPDISSYIPQDAFIDINKFLSLDDLNSFLINLSEEDGLKMINAGRNFLNSEAGKTYSFEGFAKCILDICHSWRQADGN
jgi:hypothetical protein